eukprot:1106491-Amphidinium_carterae.1
MEIEGSCQVRLMLAAVPTIVQEAQHDCRHETCVGRPCVKSMPAECQTPHYPFSKPRTNPCCPPQKKRLWSIGFIAQRFICCRVGVSYIAILVYLVIKS